MRKTVLLMLVVCFLGGAAGLVFGESGDNEEEGWKERIASPSYGLTLGFFNLTYRDADDHEQTDTLLMPGIELRHFNGIDVPRDRGFYYGYELGLGVNFSFGGHGFKDSGVDHTVDGIVAGSGFLMLKHGYRFELGTGYTRPGFGFELGAGVGAGGGAITVTRDDDPDSENRAVITGEDGIGPVFELGFEGSLNSGDEYRLVARLGVTIIPVVPLESNYGQMVPPRITLRGGFTRNH